MGASGELSFLVAAAWVRLGPDHRAGVAAVVPDGVDWTRVLHLARTNQVDALLQHGLAHAIPEAVPSDVPARLAERGRCAECRLGPDAYAADPGARRLVEGLFG